MKKPMPPHDAIASESPATAPIDWPEPLVPLPSLAAMCWGDSPVAAAGVRESERASGVMALVWRDALALGERHLSPTLLFEAGGLVRIEIVGLVDEDLERLGFLSADVALTEGLATRSQGVTLWSCDLLDRTLSLEPDPELTDAGLI